MPTTVDRSVYGAINVMDNAGATTIASSGVGNKAQFLGFTADSASNGCTPDNANDHIAITQAGDYFVKLLTCSFNGTASNKYAIEIWKNNGATMLTHVNRSIGTGNDVGSATCGDVVALAVGDTVEVWAWNVTAGNDILIEDCVLYVERKGP